MVRRRWLDPHVSVQDSPGTQDARRHFGLECADVDRMRTRLERPGVTVDPGRPAPWKRFFARDPFGNRIEIHEVGSLRA